MTTTAPARPLIHVLHDGTVDYVELPPAHYTALSGNTAPQGTEIIRVYANGEAVALSPTRRLGTVVWTASPFPLPWSRFIGVLRDLDPTVERQVRHKGWCASERQFPDGGRARCDCQQIGGAP